VFRNREAAGRDLARALEHYREEEAVVLALPRGGVPVGVPVAESLSAPLDVIVVRKLGVPYQPELAMGAVGEDGVTVINEEIVRRSGVTAGTLEAVEQAERDEVRRRADRFRGGHPRSPVRDRVAIVVDDGVATGATARAACQIARALGAKRVVLAVPIGSPDTLQRLREVADEVVCLVAPAWFQAVGEGYADFGQVPDHEVVDLLARARRSAGSPTPAAEESEPGSTSEGPGGPGA
jgi:putative phosphoribosyl transferase